MDEKKVVREGEIHRGSRSYTVSLNAEEEFRRELMDILTFAPHRILLCSATRLLR